MYAFLTGPMLWATFIIFLGGLAARVIYLIGISREKDRAVYNHADMASGLTSVVRWLIPWSGVAMRAQPLFTLAVFVFHIGLVAVPLFLSAHNILWEEALGVSLWSMPDGLADALAMATVVSGGVLLARRLVRPEVRILTEGRDYFFLLLTVTPVATGILAYHQWGPYETMLLVHILTSETLLILIPFTKLAHVVLFFFTRAAIGFEMGGRRGAPSW